MSTKWLRISEKVDRAIVSTETGAQNNGSSSVQFFMASFISLSFRNQAIILSLLDFCYLQLCLCSFNTARPFVILLFPLDGLHCARAQDIGFEACKAFAFLAQSFDLGF